MIIKTEGIIIKTLDYGEGNKILTLYTANYGKISLMARGAKKTKSRLSGVTQLFTYGQFIFFKGSQMGTLNQGEVIQRFVEVQKDIHKTAFVAYLVELVDRMVEPEQPDPYLFRQLLSGIEQINQGKDSEIVARIFEMKMLRHAGYLPNLYTCSLCGAEQSIFTLSIPDGGLICQTHLNQPTVTIQEGTLKLLRIFEQMDMGRLGNINVKASTKSQLQYILRSFFDEYVGIEFKSRHFLDQMKKYNL